MTNRSLPHWRAVRDESPAAAQVETPVDANSDLATILAAWNAATERLQQTHAALAEEVSRLTQELEIKNRQLARQNRLADLGQMASHIAHEVRNGLAPVTLYLSLLRRRLHTDQAGMAVLAKIDASFTALATTVNDLLGFASDREPDCRHFILSDLLAEVCDSLAPQLTAQGIRMEIDARRDIVARADRSMLRRALLNLILNAMDAMTGGGTLTVTACSVADGLDIEVADSGPGLADGARLRVFEPFFTTKSDGTGLGLAIVQRIAEVHGGYASASNCPEGGAAFTIHLPSIRQEAAA